MAVEQDRLLKPSVERIGGFDHDLQDARSVIGFDLNNYNVSLGRLLETGNLPRYPQTPPRLEVLLPSGTLHFLNGRLPRVGRYRQYWGRKYGNRHNLLLLIQFSPVGRLRISMRESYLILRMLSNFSSARPFFRRGRMVPLFVWHPPRPPLSRRAFPTINQTFHRWIHVPSEGCYIYVACMKTGTGVERRVADMQNIFSADNHSSVSPRWPKWTLLLRGIAFIVGGCPRCVSVWRFDDDGVQVLEHVRFQTGSCFIGGTVGQAGRFQ